MTDAVANLHAVTASIAEAVAEAGRPAGAARLVAVTKTCDAATVRPVLDAGHRLFGENRVQEAKAKWPSLRADYPGVELHLIGPLQSNKAGEAVALFDCIETVDRDRIAAAIAAEMARQNRRPRLFVQVNVGAEPQKAGIAPDEAVTFVARCRSLHGLAIDGLMAIPPLEGDPAPHFRTLARLAGEAGVTALSMGMSGDFRTAIACGATHVRVGSAIFGARA